MIQGKPSSDTFSDRKALSSYSIILAKVKGSLSLCSSTRAMSVCACIVY